MAIVTCPKCGKSTSDTNETCFHCGSSLKPQPQVPVKLQSFNRLSMADQTSLRNEFYKQNKKYDDYLNHNSKVTWLLRALKISIWVFLIGVLAISLLELVGVFVSGEWLMVIALVLACISILSFLIYMGLRLLPYRKHRRNELIIQKKFQKWLRTEKAMEYLIAFTSKQKWDKKVFDSINTQKDEIEV